MDLVGGSEHEPDTPRRLRAYRFALNPTGQQLEALQQHAGAARWAYNHANAILAQQSNAFFVRKAEQLQRISGLTPKQIETLPDEKKNKLHEQAKKAVQAENAQRRTVLDLLDEHRKRVTHKGKPGIDPGEAPADDASHEAHRLYRRRVELAELQRTDEDEYRKQRKTELQSIRPQVLALKKELVAEGAYRPNSQDIATMWRSVRDLPKSEGGSPWHGDVNMYAFTSGFDNADTAWKNWMSSVAGTRAGPRMGKPRFKKKGKSKDSFTLFGETLRLASYRRLLLPRIGEVRMHESGKRLARALQRGGVIQSVTVSRGGKRWYASVLVNEPDITPGRETQVGPSHRQKANGRIGVDLGVKHLAALSNGEVIDNPKHLERASRRLKRVQRELSRRQGPDKRTGQKPSNNWCRTRDKLAKLQHRIAEQRESYLHQVTKDLCTRFAEVAIEDLNVKGMTASAKGTEDAPGSNVSAKAGLNRGVLDVAPGEFRRQLEYKARWYGTTVAYADRWAPTSKTCSACGLVKAKLGLSERVFTCDGCGSSLDRDINAAINVAAVATVPVDPDGGAHGKRRVED